MKRVSIKQALLLAQERTDDNLSRFPAQMMKWAKYIEKEISSSLGYKVKSKAITLNGCYLHLPSDCFKVISVLPGNYEDECNAQYRNITQPLIKEDARAGEDVYDRDLTYLWKPAETTWAKEYCWEEIGDQLHMIQSFENQEVTIIYNYIDVDADGDWIVNESHLEAIAAYIEYMYARKFRFKMFKSDKLLRQGHVATLQDLKRDYNLAIRDARAKDQSESPFETEQY